jgi:hypothetical protein
MFLAEVVELADALDSKSSDGNIVRVRFPPSAPIAFKNILKAFLFENKPVNLECLNSIYLAIILLR